MNNIYRAIILLLIVGVSACVSSQPNIMAANDEDQDIGLGGTGMLADTGSGSGSGSGLGGTGILGEITGFGSVFVNGIEIEYDNDTTFTIDGEAADDRQLEIGDVVEVLTSDASQHTQASIINLRHEVIGRVESTDPDTFSFIVHGQTVIQSLDKRILPVVGTTVAVSGFRVDEHTIISTRVKPADVNRVLLRTNTEMPFKEKTKRWLVQTYVQDDKAVLHLGDTAHVLDVKDDTIESFKRPSGIKVLQLHKSDSESDSLKFDGVIKAADIPRGRKTLLPIKRPVTNMMQGPTPGKMPGATQKNGQPDTRGRR